MNSEALLPQTYRLLDDTNLTYRQIAEDCGVDANWLMKFKQRKIKEPGVTKVQQVRDFLVAYNAIRLQPTRAAETAA